MQASCSRNELAQAAVPALASTEDEISEVQELRSSLLQEGMQMLTSRHSVVTQPSVTIEGDVTALRQEKSITASTDGALHGYKHACGAILTSVRTGIKVRVSMAYLAVDTEPIVPETMARYLVIYVLWGWTGQLNMAADSASALWRRYTSLPMKDTVLLLIFRHFAAEIASKHIEEYWHRAQHTMHGTDRLAGLNRDPRNPFLDLKPVKIFGF